jgi:hypothetical protein
VPDLYHVYGNDLQVSATGDLLLASGNTLSQQRILRRLYTNPQTANAPGDYVFSPTYGAGVGKYVGSTASTQQIQSVIQGQMLREESVAQSPVPTVSVTATNTGTTTATITYTVSDTGLTDIITVPTNPSTGS